MAYFGGSNISKKKVELKGGDDLYAGFDVGPGLFESDLYAADPKRASMTRAGGRPSVGAMPGTSYGNRGSLQSRSGGGSLQRMSVSGAPGGGPGSSGSGVRNVTAVQAAGYTVGAVARKEVGMRPSLALESKMDEGPEEKFKQMERRIFALLEESCFALKRGDKTPALQKAKEAAKRERELVRERDRASTAGQPNALDSINLDLTYSVLFSLAGAYVANEMYSEALSTYSLLVRNKLFAHAGRLRLNMGNVYFALRQYDKAARQYRMALDQVPTTHQLIRCKILSNMGVALVRQGAYEDAITAFTQCLEVGAATSIAAGAASDAGGAFQAGLNLLLCHFAVGDRDKMKRVFQKMLQLDLRLEDDERYSVRPGEPGSDTLVVQVAEAIANDDLRQLEKRRRANAHACIKRAAQIIAPAIGLAVQAQAPQRAGTLALSPQASTFSAGYDWCLEQVRTSIYSDLAHDMEIDKALVYLKQKDIHMAVECLKNFEKKDTRVASTAAVNLSSLYLLENELPQAERYAEIAIKSDRYNPAALVAMGNCAFALGQLERARDHYRDAVDKDPSCTQGLYNLGLCSKKLGQFEAALDTFLRLHGLLKSDPQVLYQIAHVYEKLGQNAAAIEWYMKLVGLLPTDASVLQRLAELHLSEGDEAAAAQYYNDAYRYFPSNMEVIQWLGAHYLKAQFYEKAISFFERAAIIQPTDVQWPLAVAGCMRRSGNYQRALDSYKQVHRRFPDNVECLQQLVKLCTDLSYSKEASEYASQLKRVEKQNLLKEQARTSSGTRRVGSATGGGGVESGTVRGGAMAAAGGLSPNTSATTGSDRKKLVMDESDPYKQQGATLRVNQSDMTYSDPLGPLPERSKQGVAGRGNQRQQLDELDEPLDDLLPQ